MFVSRHYALHTAAAALALATMSFGASALAQDRPLPTDDDWEEMQLGPRRHAPGSDTLAPPTYHEPPAATSTTTTTGAEYSDQMAAEREHPTRETRPNRPLLATGIGMVILPYVGGVLVAAQSGLEQDHRLYVPIVGPWLDLGQRPCAFGSSCTTSDNVGSAFLVASGVAQGLGVVLTAVSFAATERTTTSQPMTTGVHVTPLSFAGGAGVGAFGSF